MLEIVIVILIIVVLFEGALVYFSLKRITQYENVIQEIDGVITFITEQVEKLDEKGSFRDDDEIGFFWEAITNMSQTLNNLFEQEEENAKEKN